MIYRSILSLEKREIGGARSKKGSSIVFESEKLVRMQLPRKMSAQNVMASITRTLGNREHKTTGNEIRFAGDERKDKLYEPKHKQKLVRVLTVVAYVIFVSMAAILLSLYYTFLWDPKDVSIKMRTKPDCVNYKLPNPSIVSSVVNETQIEKMTIKTTTVRPEGTGTPEIVTIDRQKSLLTILTETNDATPFTITEDFETNSSIESKGTSTETETQPTIT